MAVFKPVVRTPRKDGFYQVYIRVMHNRKPGYIKTDKVITKQSLDREGDITDAFVNEFCSRRIIRFTELLNLVDCSKWSVKQVIEYVTKEDEDLCFSDYARLHINRMMDNGQLRNAKNYKLALQHLERFAGTTQIAVAADARKDQIEQMYRANDDAYVNQLNAIEQDKANAIAGAVQGVASGASSMPF